MLNFIMFRFTHALHLKMQLSPMLSRGLQLSFCAILTHYLFQTRSILYAALLSLLIYPVFSVCIALPFRLFIYLPFLSPLRDIPSVPAELNHWRTWLAAEPTPPQLVDWVKAASTHHGENFKGVLRYYGIGGSERVLLASSAAMKEVLISKQYDFFDRPTMARKRIAVQAGNGLIASGGNVHKNQKRILLPAFSGRAIRDLYPLFCSKADELVAALHTEAQVSGSTTVDVVSWTSRSALDVIGVAAWGRDFCAISEPHSDFLKSYSAMFDISGGGQLMNALALSIPMRFVLHIPCEYNKRLKAALRSIKSRCAQVVREKKEEIRLAGENSRAQHKDILSLMIKAGIDEDEALINQMMTMLAAGHDTSSLSLAWTCHLLCKNQDVQRRLRKELRDKLPSGTREITQEAIESLPYLGAVANESLRLAPTVPMTRREALRDTEIQGYHTPEGSHIVSCIYQANRLKSLYGDDAEEFRADRWLAPGDKGAVVNDKFAFHSFSHGPRACIGQGFARGELLTFLAALVSNFEMELESPDFEPGALFGITMSPASAIKIKFSPIS